METIFSGEALRWRRLLIKPWPHLMSLAIRHWTWSGCIRNLVGEDGSLEAFPWHCWYGHTPPTSSASFPWLERTVPQPSYTLRYKRVVMRFRIKATVTIPFKWLLWGFSSRLRPSWKYNKIRLRDHHPRSLWSCLWRGYKNFRPEKSWLEACGSPAVQLRAKGQPMVHATRGARKKQDWSMKLHVEWSVDIGLLHRWKKFSRTLKILTRAAQTQNRKGNGNTLVEMEYSLPPYLSP